MAIDPTQNRPAPGPSTAVDPTGSLAVRNMLQDTSSFSSAKNVQGAIDDTQQSIKSIMVSIGEMENQLTGLGGKMNTVREQANKVVAERDAIDPNDKDADAKRTDLDGKLQGLRGQLSSLSLAYTATQDGLIKERGQAKELQETLERQKQTDLPAAKAADAATAAQDEQRSRQAQSDRDHQAQQERASSAAANQAEASGSRRQAAQQPAERLFRSPHAGSALPQGGEPDAPHQRGGREVTGRAATGRDEPDGPKLGG